MKLIVHTIRDEAAGIRSFRLMHPECLPLPPYEAGSHIDITGPTGVTRQYSLCGDPADRQAYVVAVKLEQPSRGGSAALHAAVQAGDTLEAGPPRSLFGLAPAASEHLLFGAGIGITPLLSMAYALQARGARYTLHYFARGPEFAAYAGLLADGPFAANVRFHYAVAPDAIAAALAPCFIGGAGAHAYTCGPAAFMQQVVDAAAAAGLPEDAMHLEHFQAQPAAASPLDEQSFEVELAQSRRVLVVAPGVTIVDVLAQAGIQIDTSCREGICGTCVVPLLDGEPEHRDHCLSKKEKAANDQICACISRSRSARLVLDL
jgi:vanillate O-demethylase ferredoxin subunit